MFLRVIAALSIFLAAVPLLSGCQGVVVDEVEKPQVAIGSAADLGNIVDLYRDHPEIAATYLTFSNTNDEELFDEQVALGHPTFATGQALSAWLIESDTELAVRRAEKMIDTWNLRDANAPAKLNYKFDYVVNGQTLPAEEWWSAMSDFSFPILLVGLWQETKNLEYKEIAERLVLQALKPVDEGGAVWPVGGNCWLSEYAWEGMTQSDELWVLNGAMYALVSLGLLSSSLDSEALSAAFSSCAHGTMTKFPDFLEDSAWPLYMLHEPTINQPHYVTFEITLLDALFRITGEEAFSDQATLRRGMLGRNYPIVGIRENQKNRIVFTQNAGPHPYLPDLRFTELTCTDSQIVQKFRLTSPRASPFSYEKAFLDEETDLNLEQTTCDVFETRSPEHYKVPIMLNQPVLVSENFSADPFVPSSAEGTLNVNRIAARTFSLKPLGDANPAKPTSAQSRINVTPDASINLRKDASHESLFGFTISADVDVNLRLVVFDGDLSCSRTYPSITAGEDNLVLLSLAGFKDCAEVNSVDSIRLVFPRASLDEPSAVEIGELMQFKDISQFRTYSMTNDVVLNRR